MKNALKWVQTSLVLVQQFLRYHYDFANFFVKFELLYIKILVGV